MDVLDLLKQNLEGEALNNMTKNVGANDPKRTQQASMDIGNILITALNKNAQTKGTSGLLQALDRDHDGSILDDLAGFAGGNFQAQNSKMLDGMGILNHILGPRTNNAVQMVSEKNGLNQQSTTKLMAMIAPIVMGFLGRQKRDQNLDSNGLQGLLNQLAGQTNQRRQSNLTGNLLNSLLDADGDGDISDDLMKQGSQFLGNLFNKR